MVIVIASGYDEGFCSVPPGISSFVRAPLIDYAITKLT